MESERGEKIIRKSKEALDFFFDGAGNASNKRVLSQPKITQPRKNNNNNNKK